MQQVNKNISFKNIHLSSQIRNAIVFDDTFYGFLEKILNAFYAIPVECFFMAVCLTDLNHMVSARYQKYFDSDNLPIV